MNQNSCTNERFINEKNTKMQLTIVNRDFIIMLNIHVFGFLKKKFDPNAKLSEQTIVKLDFINNESFLDLLKRVNIEPNELGDCFINGSVVMTGNEIIPDESRVSLFSVGMLLHEGGQYLKYKSIYEGNL